MTDSTMGSNLAGLVLVTCAVVFTLLSSADVSEARPNVFSRFQTVSDDNNMYRSRRGPGFRQGAIDRVGHQFGKRSELDELLAPPEQPAEFIITDEYIANALSNNPKLALTFVRRYMDVNEDGVVTSEELQPFVTSD